MNYSLSLCVYKQVNIHFFIAETFDENGEKIIYNQVVAFVVGAGNFGGKKQTSRIVPVIEAPTRDPDTYFVDKTLIDQVNIFFLYLLKLKML